MGGLHTFRRATGRFALFEARQGRCAGRNRSPREGAVVVSGEMTWHHGGAQDDALPALTPGGRASLPRAPAGAGVQWHAGVGTAEARMRRPA